MARIRTIKPEFFLDSDLCELSPLHRLLFVGLWCQADRAGKLEDKPRELKVKVLPYDDCDVDRLLHDLAVAGFVVRYTVGDKDYLYIPTFARHQHPHIKETESLCPDPPDSPPAVIPVEHQAGTGQAPVSHGSSREEGKGREGKDLGKEGSGASPPPPSQTYAVLVVEPPDTPPETWLGPDFWRWCQVRRQAARLIAEKPPDHRKLSTWWSSVRMVVSDVKAMKEAFYAFGNDSHWKAAQPPLPFAGFMSQWQKYVPQLTGGPNAPS